MFVREWGTRVFEHVRGLFCLPDFAVATKQTRRRPLETRSRPLETRRRPSELAVALPFLFVLAGPAGGTALGSEPAEFFEQRVRPVLVRHCTTCHGPERHESGLRVDSRTSMLEGGDRGPAVVGGDAEGSLLIEAIRYDTEDLQMPPDGKLSEQEIQALVDWIEAGAPWPGDEPPTTPPRPDQAQSPHWAFQPIRQPDLPDVRDRDWPRNAIDMFVLAELEAKQLRPAESATPAQLVRRLYLDLLGQPATYAQVQAYLADTRPDAYPRLVDALLASPAHAEHAASYWLDVARYADTKGYVDGAQTEYPFAYTYRDYVIRALQEDMPYDEFLLDQLTADQLSSEPARAWRLAALGFLTVGRRFNENVPDILDDRIDVITRGLMGLTVSWRDATITSTIQSRPATTTRYTVSSPAATSPPMRTCRCWNPLPPRRPN